MNYICSKKLFIDIWEKYGKKKEISEKLEIYNFLNEIVTRSQGKIIVDHFSSINFDVVKKIEYKDPYILIYWKDYEEIRQKCLDDNLSDMEYMEWSLFDYSTYAYMLLNISKIRIIELKNNILVTFLSNLIPKKAIEKTFDLKKENEIIYSSDNPNELYSRYVFFEGKKEDLKKHTCIVNNLPYYTCLIQHKENCTSSVTSKKILLMLTLEEINIRISKVYKSLIDLDEDMDEIFAKGNTIRRIMEYLLKYYCLYNNIEIGITDKYGHIKLGDLNKKIKKNSDLVQIDQNIINISNEMSHDSGSVFTKPEIIEFCKNVISLIDSIQNDILVSYNNKYSRKR